MKIRKIISVGNTNRWAHITVGSRNKQEALVNFDFHIMNVQQDIMKIV